MSSQNSTIYEILNAPQTVFTPALVSQITHEENRRRLMERMNYYVKAGLLRNPRKGIYSKKEYSKLEMASSIFTPCYVSLQYVLRKSGVIFQYDEAVTMVSYLSRDIEIDGIRYTFRKIKGEIMANMLGIDLNGIVSMATPERAALDILYLYPDFYFDDPDLLDKKKISEILPIYGSKAMDKRVSEIFR